MDKSTPLNGKVVRINHCVMFRASRVLTVRNKYRVGIHIKDINTSSLYEFTGKMAILFLLLDGVRTYEKAAHLCKKIIKNKDPNFANKAYRFFENLVELNLVVDCTNSPQRDVRYDDLRDYLKKVKNSLNEKKIKLPKAKKTISEPGDSAKILEVKKSLSKLIKKNTRVVIKRYITSIRKGAFHIFSASIYIPGLKKALEGMGASTEIERAIWAATGEAIERQFTFIEEAEVFSKSYNDLKKTKYKVLNPDSYRFFDPKQPSIRYNEVMNLDKKAKINWVWFEDAFSKQKVLIPGPINGARPLRNQPELYGETTGSGCAAATDKENAKLRAALELIERDNLLFYWRTKNTPQLIDVSRPNERIKKLLDLLGDLRHKVKLFYLKSDLAPTTVQAILFGDPKLGEPRFTSNTATRMDPVDAIEKAIIELLYVVSGQIQNCTIHRVHYGKSFDNTIWDFGDRSDFYGSHQAKMAYDFLNVKNSKIINKSIKWNKIPNLETGNAKKNLSILISSFRKSGNRLYFKNNTPLRMAKIGFWIYRAFSPDLILIEGVHRYRQLGSPRYRRLATYLKLKNKPKSMIDLNQWPHPLP